MMLLQITVSALTTPLKVENPELTVTILADTSTIDAVIVTFAEALTVMPLDCILTELPLLSTISTDATPSFKVMV